MASRTGSHRRPSGPSLETTTTVVEVSSAPEAPAPKRAKAIREVAPKAASAKPASAKPASAKSASKGPTTRKQRRPTRRKKKQTDDLPPEVTFGPDGEEIPPPIPAIRVRRMHRRDINRAWEFLKRVFRDVNQKTVEYQRPRSKQRFEESYNDEGIAQLIFEVHGDIVGYAECSFEVTGSDNWINPRYFESRDMRPLYVEELAVHPDFQGRGVGSFMLEQLDHLARLRGCTHLVLEVAENNADALTFYRKRNFTKLDATLFMAHRIEREPELLPPRVLRRPS